MRKLVAVALTAFVALAGTPARAADMPEYPPIEVPEVDYGLQGSYYLRASIGGNLLWTREHVDTTGASGVATEAGYGYSFGAGFGYETGDGLRADLTLDYLQNTGLTDGADTLDLRSTILLANVYYDFPMTDGLGSAEGGFGAYVGAGIGGAYYQTVVTPPDVALPDGTGFAPAAAAMAGVTYDTGIWVADLGYRLIYIPTITNSQAALSPLSPFYLNDNTVHELRASVRYRLN